MPRCPNCSRETLRTEDWACQWCGYPLLSSSYKKIPKTYKQLKEERLHKPEPIQKREPEPWVEPMLESQEEPIPEAKKEAETIPEVIPVLLPKPELEPESVVEPEIEPELETKEGEEIIKETEPEAEVETEPESKIEPVLEHKEEAEPIKEFEPEPELKIEQVQELESEPELESKAEPESETESESEVEIFQEFEKEAELEPATIELTVEELFSAYEADEAAADAKFVNKILKVTGVVAMIDIKEKLDIHYIRLTGAEEDLLQSVQCVFNKKHAPALEQLEKGQTVTVQGTYNGSIIAIRMVDCVLVL